MQPYNKLYDAVSYGNYSAAKALLKGGHPVNNHPLSSLYKATENGDDAMVQLLLDHNADPNHPIDHEGNTPWHSALTKGKFSIVDKFLNVAIPPHAILATTIKTGNVETVAKIVARTQPDLALLMHNTSCPMASKLLSLLATENISTSTDIARLLFQHGAPAHGFDSRHQKTPLILSIIHNKYDLAKLLIKHGAHLEIGDSLNTKSPLFVAVEHKNIPMVNYLLKHGASPNSSHTEPPIHKSLMHQAALGPVEIASLLVSYGADINAVDHHGKTPLHHAVAHSNNAVVEFLLKQKNIDMNHQASGHALVTPLHKAAYQGHSDIVKLLIDQGANPNIRNIFGRTAVHDAVLSKSAETLAMILQSKPNLDIVDNDEQTPLFVAISTGFDTAAEMLLEAGANPNIAAKTIYPIHKAAYLAKKEILPALIHHGADVNVRNFLGKTPLHDAATCQLDQLHEDRSFIAKLLLSSGADHSLLDGEGATPLFTAVKNESPQLTSTLLEAGANPNIACKTITPLHEACLNGLLEISKNLVNHGADVNAINCLGKTPLHDAAQSPRKNTENKTQIMQFLLDNNANAAATDNAGRTAFEHFFRTQDRPFKLQNS